MLNKLSDLAVLKAPGSFGSHDTALVWLIITAVLMFVGPALVALFYVLSKADPQSVVIQHPSVIYGKFRKPPRKKVG